VKRGVMCRPLSVIMMGLPDAVSVIATVTSMYSGTDVEEVGVQVPLFTRVNAEVALL
jgi:hypothetical protein